MKSVNSPPCHLVYRTKLGRLYCGKSEEVLQTRRFLRHKGKVQLVFTSPPFPLNRKKKYGNLSGTAYAQWLAAFASILAGYLTRKMGLAQAMAITLIIIEVAMTVVAVGIVLCIFRNNNDVDAANLRNLKG